MMAPPLFAPDCAVAVTPPNRTEPRPKTALSGVFHRIAHEPEPAPAPISPPMEPPPAASEPPPAAAEPPLPSPLLRVTHSRHLLGFAEPVANIPPIEDFLPPDADAAGPETAECVEEPAPEPAPPSEPPPAAPPEPIRARVRDLPPDPSVAAVSPSRGPRNFVERLGRQLGEAVVAPTRDDPPRFEPLPERTTPASAAWRPPEPPPRPEPVVRRRAEPVLPDMAEPAPPADRGERPSIRQNRRLYRRAKLSAELEIAGVPCTLIDVSIGGFAATGVTQVEPNTLVPATIRLMIDGIEVGTQLQARIVYVTQGRSSGRFVELSPSQMAFLRYIVTWRGESIGAVGMTTLLDAIAGGPERGFSGNRSDDASKSRWWAGLIGRKITPPR